MKKKINFARVTWVVCLFLFLIIVLLMIMDYKINYQYLTHNLKILNMNISFPLAPGRAVKNPLLPSTKIPEN